MRRITRERAYIRQYNKTTLIFDVYERVKVEDQLLILTCSLDRWEKRRYTKTFASQQGLYWIDAYRPELRNSYGCLLLKSDKKSLFAFLFDVNKIIKHNINIFYYHFTSTDAEKQSNDVNTIKSIELSSKMLKQF